MKHVRPAKVLVIATQHLDVAWLWNRVPHGEELMRMVFELALDLARRDPAARFVMSRSTAWGYRIVERKYPELFVRVQEAVRSGSIELAGGQWVEPDNLIPSGESQIRQGLYGQSYFQSRFGKTASVAWNPDVFGHGSTLPQIYRQIGLRGYYFHRMLPVDEAGDEIGAFVWTAPDASTVTCFAGNWTGRPDDDALAPLLAGSPAGVVPVQALVVGRMSDRRMTITPDWLSLPREVGERLGLEECRWAGADEVLDELELVKESLPVVRGDLGGYSYTGTYTSDQITKRFNRRLENRLAAAELLGTWAALEGGTYDAGLIGEAWRNVCLNQFHDIICGTCYRSAQEEAHALYRETCVATDSLIRSASTRVSERVRTNERAGVPVVVHNPAPVASGEPVTVPTDLSGPLRVVDAEGTLLASQDASEPASRPATAGIGQTGSRADRPARAIRVNPGTIPASGYRVVYLQLAERGETVRDDALTLENEFLRVEVDASYGSVTSLYDKRQRTEYVKPGGRFNRIETYEDRNDYPCSPDHRWDPWYIRLTGARYDPQGAYRVTVVENGPVQKTIRVERSFRICPNGPDTVIIQDLSLAAGSPLLRVDACGDWQAAQACMKAEFDLAHSVSVVSCDMPYGVIDRPAEYRGSRQVGSEAAEDSVEEGVDREELDRPMQMWIDASDGEHGLAILNNGKYGYDSRQDQLRLSLMRAPFIRPGEVAGLGPFEFSYAIYPHAGRWSESDVPERALVFNRDPVAVTSWRHDGSLPSSASLFTLDDDSVHLNVVKQAEGGSDVVLRLFESRGSGRSVRVTSRYPIARVWRTDALEVADETASMVRPNGEYTFVAELGAWQIATFRLRMQTSP